MFIRASIAIWTGKSHLILQQAYMLPLPSCNNNQGRWSEKKTQYDIQNEGEVFYHFAG